MAAPKTTTRSRKAPASKAAQEAPNADAAAEDQPDVAPAQDGVQAQDAPAAAEAKNAAQDAPAAPAEQVAGIWVRSVKPSFRRCGMRFTREGVSIAVDALTEDELATLENDPHLVVERMTFTDERLST